VGGGRYPVPKNPGVTVEGCPPAFVSRSPRGDKAGKRSLPLAVICVGCRTTRSPYRGRGRATAQDATLHRSSLAHLLPSGAAAECSERCLWGSVIAHDQVEPEAYLGRRVCLRDGTSLRSFAFPNRGLLSERAACSGPPSGNASTQNSSQSIPCGAALRVPGHSGTRGQTRWRPGVEPKPGLLGGWCRRREQLGVDVPARSPVRAIRAGHAAGQSACSGRVLDQRTNPATWSSKVLVTTPN
jgi:hypothetical protein